MSNSQFLEMSDEDFLKKGVPDGAPDPVDQAPSSTPVDDTASKVNDASDGDANSNKEEAFHEPAAESKASDTDPSRGTDGADSNLEPTQGSDAGADSPEPAKTDSKEEAKPEDTAPEKETSKEPVKNIDYESFYKQIMAPFKANGRMVEPKTPEEAIRLMQMGAGFGRKLQDMQPHVKSLRMLEKNGLLDEGKLSFLIDIHNKNPDAIKKLIAESGIDPLDVNTEDNTKYIPQNHSVSDEEVAFHDAMAEVQAQPTGSETLSIINQTWDAQSKAVLWQSPELLGVIQFQRENGIYDRIVAEIDRQKIFGSIAMNAPFLEAYKTAGDALQAAGAFRAKAQDPKHNQGQVQVGETKPTPQVIATRTEAPKKMVVNSDQASAAAPSSVSTNRRATTTVNPLNMADDEFLKQFQGRL
jgi:hypothetical protein